MLHAMVFDGIMQRIIERSNSKKKKTQTEIVDTGPNELTVYPEIRVASGI